MSRGPADAASGVIAARQRVRSEGSEEQAAQQVASGPSDEMTERNRRGRHLSQELLSVWNVVTTGCRAAATGGAFLYHNNANYHQVHCKGTA